MAYLDLDHPEPLGCGRISIQSRTHRSQVFEVLPSSDDALHHSSRYSLQVLAPVTAAQAKLGN